jgi:hypothetical protein
MYWFAIAGGAGYSATISVTATVSSSVSSVP